MEEFWLKPDYEVISGSHLYGVNDESSDLDIRGFVVEPIEYALGLKKFEQYEPKGEDRVIYGLKKFLQLLTTGNCQCLEILMASKIKFATVVGMEVALNVNLFVSKSYYRSIKGFAFAEWRRVRGTMLAPVEQRKSEYDIINEVCSGLSMKSYDRDKIMGIFSEIGFPLQQEIKNPNIESRREAEIEKYGYNLKTGYNTIRLLSQGIELLTCGSMTFPRPEADLLKQIRAGQISLSELTQYHDKLEKEMDLAYEQSSLPETADFNRINDLYIKIIKETI